MDNILQQQLDYYRARADEYDEWFYRVGRYDHGEAHTQRWFHEVELVRNTLFSLGQFKDVLELACGTGIWTQELVKISQQVMAVDASAEVIAINRRKLPNSPVNYLQADLFTWEPDRQYDLVFFGFWLSHVPPEKLAGFLALVAKAAKPNGHIFFVDSRKTDTSGAKNHHSYDQAGIYHTRKLNDGREFQIIKIFYEPDVLTEKFGEVGFDLTAKETAEFFVYGHGTRRPS